MIASLCRLNTTLTLNLMYSICMLPACTLKTKRNVAFIIQKNFWKKKMFQNKKS